MENKKIITGIDIGTTKIAVIIAEASDDGKITILGDGITPSYGLKKGEVVDIPKTRNSIDKAIREAEEKSNYKVDSAFIGITGDHIRGMSYSQFTDCEDEGITGSEIQEKDIVKVREKIRAFPLASDRKILHVLDQEYRVDEQKNIENPRGLYGRRLELNAFVVHITKNSINNLKNCLNENVHINEFVLEPLASAYAVLNNQQKNLGTVLIDIGGGTTDILIYENNGVRYTGAIDKAGDIITRDIAVGIQQKTGECLENTELEILKHDYGSAKKECVDEDKKINLNIEDRQISITEYELANIIQSRVTEIFIKAKRMIDDNSSNQPYGVIITGGGSQLKNIEELASEIFKQNVIIGFPRNIEGSEHITKNPRFSTAIGLIKYGVESLKVENITQGITVKSTLKDLFENLKRLYNRWY